MRVAGYCRVSTDRDDQVNSFESQCRYFQSYISAKADWELVDIYADEGITGTSTKKRTQFNRMLVDAREGKIDLIVTKEISRFSRNILDTLRYTRQLKALGIGVYFLNDGLNSLEPDAELRLSIMGSVAQEESRRTSQRVKWGQTRQMERGVVFGRSLLGYQVKEGRMTIESEGAKLVRLIFEKYGIEGKGTGQIARELQMAGYRTGSGSSQWSRSYIVKILRNEKYVGDLVQKKTYTPDYLTHIKRPNHGEEEMVIIQNHHEPIVERELWQKVQNELKKRSRHNPSGHSNRYVFSGKIKCGACGSSFVSRQKTQSNGSKLRRWSCGRATGDGGCGVGRLLRDDDAMDMLRQVFCALRLDVDYLSEEVLKRLPLEQKQRLSQSIHRIEGKRVGLMDTYLEGHISKEEMLVLKRRYEQQISQLQRQMDSTPDNDAFCDTVTATLKSILSGKEECELMCRMLLEKITVFPDRHMELCLRQLGVVFRFVEEVP